MPFGLATVADSALLIPGSPQQQKSHNVTKMCILVGCTVERNLCSDRLRQHFLSHHTSVYHHSAQLQALRKATSLGAHVDKGRATRITLKALQHYLEHAHKYNNADLGPDTYYRKHYPILLFPVQSADANPSTTQVQLTASCP